jgi:HD superfamily phosphodiesterase
MTPADYPLIDPKTINDIKACYEETKSSIICPVFEGKTGHPCLFSMKFKNDILNKDLKLGLRSILKENFSDIKYIKSENPYITIDMDTQSDYKQVLNLLKTAPPFWCDIADEILKKDKTPSNIVNHGKAVAKLSKIIAGTLIAKGYNIDLDLLISAAKLHDFKKSEKAHAAAGGTFLSDLGYPTLGKIVKSHMGDGIEINKTITEKEILFLADKMIKGTSLVSIENRFSFSYKKFRNCKEIISEIKHRENMARKIKRQIEDIIDKDLDTIISEAYYE